MAVWGGRKNLGVEDSKNLMGEGENSHHCVIITLPDILLRQIFIMRTTDLTPSSKLGRGHTEMTPQQTLYLQTHSSRLACKDGSQKTQPR